jgi:hypothetical protein
MLIKKIISGAQTGADRAALDYAIKNDIPHGGWVPKGRIAEDGILPKKYNVHETPSDDYKRHKELNVVQSDGTLIVSHGELMDGTALSRTFVEKHSKPCLQINLNSTQAFKASIDITNWIRENGIQILNVSGPKASKDPDIYDATMKLLETVFLLRVIDDNVPDLIYKNFNQTLKERYPEFVDQAVDRLISEMPLRDKVRFAEMSDTDFEMIHPSMSVYVIKNYGLWGDSPLLSACRELSGNKDLTPEEAALLVIKKLWEKLRDTHRMRLV